MSRPIGPFQFRDRRYARRAFAILALLFALVLASCGDESGGVPEDRQFANDPVERQDVTATSEVIVDATPEVTQAAVTASPETLLRSRGTPNTLYTLIDGNLIALSIHDDEGVPTQVVIPDGQQILDFDGSPTGDRVAVLMASAENETVSLAFFYSNGEQLGQIRTVQTGGASATPVAPTESTVYEVSWSPQGTGVLVASPTVLEIVTIDGEPEPISLDDFDGQLIDAARSPQGSRVYLQFSDEDGSQHVYVRDLETDKTREVRVLGATPGNGVTNIQWLPDGSGMVCVQGLMTDGVVIGGQLYVYVLGQEAPQLISTSGQGGPSATITDAVVSPDGRSVAYVISLLDGNNWVFHSMWVRALDGSVSQQVPVDSRGVVKHLSWLNRGLAWEQSPQQGVPGDIFLIREGGELIVALDASSEAVVSTPGASPVVGSIATPVATPISTPNATPQ